MEFRMYVSPEPTGDWRYRLDDFGVVYGPGDWPFYSPEERYVPAVAKDQFGKQYTYNRYEILDHPPLDPVLAIQYRQAVRLNPQPNYCSANQTYARIFPWGDGFSARLEYMGSKQGMGGNVIRFGLKFDFNLEILGVTLGKAHALDQYRDVIDLRAKKIQEFMRAAIAERDSGVKRPTTYHDEYMEQQKVGRL